MKALGESMDSQHERLLHTEERRLSRGRLVLSPLSWAQGRNKRFSIEMNSQLVEFLLHVMWVSLGMWRIHFAIWTSLEQGFCTIIFVLKIKTHAFKKTLVLWDGFAQMGVTEMFTTLNDFLTSVDVNAKELLDIISQNWWGLAYHFQNIIFVNIRILEMKPYMIVIICCNNWNFILPVRKKFLRFLPVRRFKKVENHWLKEIRKAIFVEYETERIRNLETGSSHLTGGDKILGRLRILL